MQLVHACANPSSSPVFYCLYFWKCTLPVEIEPSDLVNVDWGCAAGKTGYILVSMRISFVPKIAFWKVG